MATKTKIGHISHPSDTPTIKDPMKLCRGFIRVGTAISAANDMIDAHQKYIESHVSIVIVLRIARHRLSDNYHALRSFGLVAGGSAVD